MFLGRPALDNAEKWYRLTSAAPMIGVTSSLRRRLINKICPSSIIFKGSMVDLGYPRPAGHEGTHVNALILFHIGPNVSDLFRVPRKFVQSRNSQVRVGFNSCLSPPFAFFVAQQRRQGAELFGYLSTRVSNAFLSMCSIR